MCMLVLVLSMPSSSPNNFSSRREVSVILLFGFCWMECLTRNWGTVSNLRLLGTAESGADGMGVFWSKKLGQD